MLEGLAGISSCEDENPEVYVDGCGGSAGDPDYLYFFGEICQEFFCEILIDTDTHHVVSLPDCGGKKKARRLSGLPFVLGWQLDVEVLYVERVFLDELAPCLDVFAHQCGEDLF